VARVNGRFDDTSSQTKVRRLVKRNDAGTRDAMGFSGLVVERGHATHYLPKKDYSDSKMCSQLHATGSVRKMVARGPLTHKDLLFSARR